MDLKTQALSLIKQGNNNKQVAAALGRSVRWVNLLKQSAGVAKARDMDKSLAKHALAMLAAGQHTQLVASKLDRSVRWVLNLKRQAKLRQDTATKHAG